MEIKRKTTKQGKIKAILSIFHFNLGLSDLEIEMLSVLLVNKINIIDTGARELIRKVMNRDKFSTNNYIKRLKDKKVIVQKEGGLLEINQHVVNLVEHKEITFKFEVE